MLVVYVVAADPGSVGILTIEGNSIEGVYAGIDTSGAILLKQGDTQRTLPVADLMILKRIEAQPAEPPAELPVVIHLADGSRFYARIVGGDAKHIEVETRLAAQLNLPLAGVAAVRFSTVKHTRAAEVFNEHLADRSLSEDILCLLRDDRVTVLRGVVESLSVDEGVFRWRDRSLPIYADNVYGIVLAAGVHQVTKQPACCLLSDGSVWCGSLVGGDASSLRLNLIVGKEIELPMERLTEIRFHSDRVTFLSDLEPAGYEFIPFSTTCWPYRRDRSVANRPMRIGAQTFERGLGMHSQAKLVYELSDHFSQFAAVIGIDEAVGSLGNAIFRVLADGKEVFNSGPVTGRDEPRPILVPIEGVKLLELHVDFGQDLDIGDQANWANARLIKSR